MTNTFTMLIMVTLVSSNWVNFPGDIHREGGTNMIHQYQLVTTNIHVEQVTLCTNRSATVSVGEGTNSVTRWVDATPPLPKPIKPNSDGLCITNYLYVNSNLLYFTPLYVTNFYSTNITIRGL